MKPPAPAPHVAILDDEPEIRRMLSDALEEAGFRTTSFGRATEFEAALKRAAPDVCLVDLGAVAASWIMLRLPLEVAPMMKDWLETRLPGHAAKVMARIRDVHGQRQGSAADTRLTRS